MFYSTVVIYPWIVTGKLSDLHVDVPYLNRKSGIIDYFFESLGVSLFSFVYESAD